MAGEKLQVLRAFPPSSPRTVERLTEAVMRPRGAVSTCLTPRLSLCSQHRPLAALTHSLWSHIHSHTLQHAPGLRTGEKQQEAEEGGRNTGENECFKVGKEEKFCENPPGKCSVDVVGFWLDPNTPVDEVLGCFTASPNVSMWWSEKGQQGRQGVSIVRLSATSDCQCSKRGQRNVSLSA